MVSRSRGVSDGEPVRVGLPEAVASGDRRVALEALRDDLAARLPGAESNVAAQLARQLVVVLREIAALPTPAAESKVDDLARKRARRIAKAASQ